MAKNWMSEMSGRDLLITYNADKRYKKKYGFNREEARRQRELKEEIERRKAKGELPKMAGVTRKKKSPYQFFSGKLGF